MKLTTVNQIELERRILYSMLVAGKSATFASAKIAGIELELQRQNLTGPIFQNLRYILNHRSLPEFLRTCKTGSYARLERGIRELLAADLDLRHCTAETLESIHGIGPKTARFFIIWTRPDAIHAALDVHVLRWLREQGHDAPTSTPSGKKYIELERTFIREAEDRGMTPRELDWQIWRSYNKSGVTT